MSEHLYLPCDHCYEYRRNPRRCILKKTNNKNVWAWNQYRRKSKKHKWRCIGHTLWKPENNIARQTLEWNQRGQRRVEHPRWSWQTSKKLNKPMAAKCQMEEIYWRLKLLHPQVKGLKKNVICMKKTILQVDARIRILELF